MSIAFSAAALLVTAWLNAMITGWPTPYVWPVLREFSPLAWNVIFASECGFRVVKVEVFWTAAPRRSTAEAVTLYIAP